LKGGGLEQLGVASQLQGIPRGVPLHLPGWAGLNIGDHALRMLGEMSDTVDPTVVTLVIYLELRMLP